MEKRILNAPINFPGLINYMKQLCKEYHSDIDSKVEYINDNGKLRRDIILYNKE